MPLPVLIPKGLDYLASNKAFNETVRPRILAALKEFKIDHRENFDSSKTSISVLRGTSKAQIEFDMRSNGWGRFETTGEVFFKVTAGEYGDRSRPKKLKDDLAALLEEVENALAREDHKTASQNSNQKQRAAIVAALGTLPQADYLGNAGNTGYNLNNGPSVKARFVPYGPICTFRVVDGVVLCTAMKYPEVSANLTPEVAQTRSALFLATLGGQ